MFHHPLYSQPTTDKQRERWRHYHTEVPYKGFFGLNAGVAFLAGAASGACITILSCPFEFTKVASQIELLVRRRQLAPFSDVPIYPIPTPKTPFQIARNIYSGRGILGLYSGFNYHLGTLS
jgi:Mitochondrial carrier protein